MSFFYFIISACFGSFISCFAERRRKNISQFERSHCMNCGAPIAPLFLAPILGYFFCHGRCTSCHTPIPKLLPCLEIFGGFIGIVLSYQTSNIIHLISQLLITSVLLLMSLDDYTMQWIHDSDLLIYSIFILFDTLTFNHLFWSERILGTCIVSLPLLLIHRRSPEALGSGDVIFIALSGFYLGMIDITYAFLIGIVAALIFSAWQILRHNATKESSIPLIPFLSLGVLSMMIL